MNSERNTQSGCRRSSRRRQWTRRLPGFAGLAVPLVLAVGFTGVTSNALASEPDQPDGFSARILAGHTAFADEVAAQFRFTYKEPGDNPGELVADLGSAGTVVMAEVEWEPNGSSGWHTHPGAVVVAIVEGALEVTNADDCVTRTYQAGQAWIDPGQGNVHVAVNPSGEDRTRVYATFFGVPNGEPGTVHVPPADC